MEWKKISQFIPLLNIKKWVDVRKEYKTALAMIDDMTGSDGWNLIQSNYNNSDIIYDKVNKFIYINTGVQYLTSVNPNFMIANWVDKWSKYITQYHQYMSIDCIVPQVAQISSEVSTYHIWLHPLVELEDSYLEISRNTLLSNLALALASAIGALTYFLL